MSELTGGGRGLTAEPPERPTAADEPVGVLDGHLAGLAAALLPYRQAAGQLARWGGELARTLVDGGRLLVAGNGGSAAEAQHLAAELVGKLRDDRVPLSAIALHAETSSVTAIGNDYGFEEVFARQVRAHGRAGDVLLLMSTSGRSANLLAAARAGRELGLRCWAFTGPAPNPLAERCAEVLAVPAGDPQVVQELHLVSAHLLCDYVDAALANGRRTGAAAGTGVAPTAAAPAGAGTGPAGAGAEGEQRDGPVPVSAAGYARPGPTRPSGVEALVLDGDNASAGVDS